MVVFCFVVFGLLGFVVAGWKVVNPGKIQAWQDEWRQGKAMGFNVETMVRIWMNSSLDIMVALVFIGCAVNLLFGQ